MPKRQTDRIEDVDGDVIELSADHYGMVRIRVTGRVADLDEKKQLEFAAAFLAKCREAHALAAETASADAEALAVSDG